jgi:hypothetical protein
VPVEGEKIRQLLELAANRPQGNGEQPDSEPQTPPADPPHPPRLLTVAMATFDDFDGVYFSVQALRMYHPEVLDRISILVVDNDPTGNAAWPLKGLAGRLPEMRYVPCADVRGTAVRDLLFRYATSEWVMCIDSHVLFEPGVLARLVDYLETHPDSDDLLQGPIAWDELNGAVATHFDPVWREGMYGVWERDERGTDRDAVPFDIPMQGLGCFVARRESWLGFNPRFRGFGGEEGYLHEKYRQHGRRTLCLPFLRWVHRFERPRGIRYANRWDDRIRNYLIGWSELGIDDTDIVQHFTELVGPEVTERVVGELATERRNPFWFFDAIYCINLDRQPERWAEMQERFGKLGIAERVRRFAAVDTPGCHDIGCALSHRRIIDAAHQQGLDNVLVLEDDAVFLEGTRWCLRRSLDELALQTWDVLYLGGHRWGATYPRAPGCDHLELPTGLTCSHAVAYHRPVYERILADVPDTPEEVAIWRNRHMAIDQYLCGALKDRARFVTAPSVATQNTIRAQEDPALRDAFTI